MISEKNGEKKEEKEEYEPKFMEWGIISRENFTSIKEVPIKRWDPLSTVIIQAADFGLQKQIRHYGHYSYVSPIRGKRPMHLHESEKRIDTEKLLKSSKKKKDQQDVFSAITEGHPIKKEDGSILGDAFTIIIAEDENRRDNPFSDVPHRIPKLPNSCKAVTLINRYPSMVRIIDSTIEEKIIQNLPKNSKLARGINLITLSRHFYPSLNFNSIPVEALTGIFKCMRTAILYTIEEAINRDYYDIPVTPFFNIGSLAGGSQPRIHAQVYVDLSMDGHGSRLEGYLKAFKEMGDNCHLCTSDHGEESSRIVLDSKYWIFFMTGSPIRNYHLRFHPKEHLRRFVNLKPSQMKDLARGLKKVFKALDELQINKNRNIIFNCCPYGYDADFHLFGDIIPHEIIGGAEMAEDMRVARKLPEEAAEEIRKVIYS